jgi:hypothetical protein
MSTMAETYEINYPSLAANQKSAMHWQRWIALVWLLAVFCGLGILWQYSGTPGASTRPPERWPVSSGLQLSSSGKTLVMFLHPHCPCSRASLTELARIVAQCHGAISPWIVFYKPNQVQQGWEHSDLWETAANIPGARVVSDPDGIEAKRFHAATSGQTLVYDSNGLLLFNGGVTGSRGHEGDNDGRATVVEILSEGKSTCRETPVFGCPILPTAEAQ